MDTGQLFMQLSVKSKVDFTVPVNTPITPKPVQKKEFGSFDSALKEATPKHYSKTEQPARPEAKRPLLKNAEQADEPDTQQPARVVSSKTNETEKTSDSDKLPAAVSSKEQTPVDIPQNVDMSAVVAVGTLPQPLPEGRMPQLVATENEADDLVMAQNAIQGLQSLEGKTLQAVMPKTELNISEEKAGPQNATDSVLPLSVEIGTEVLNDKSQLQAELLSQNTVSQAMLVQQPGNLQAGLPSQEPKNIALKGEEIGLTPAVAPSQSLTVDEQPTAAKTDPGSIVVAKPDQQSDKTDAVKQKPVLVQDAVKTVSNDVLTQVVLDDSLQKSVKSQAPAATTDFRFSRSASVEASLGIAGSVIDQPREKLAVSSTDSGKPFAKVELSGNTLSELSGSESGFMGKDAEGFGQQNLELPKQGFQQMTNVQVVGSTSLSAGNVEQVAPQQIRAASSESVAGQVKAQLGTREIKQGSEQITIQLSPDHLGDIKVNFRLEDQRLKVEIVAENRSARESLLQHADSLKESLARQNINMDKFEVTGGNNGNANQGGNSQPEWREMAKNRQSQQWQASGGYRTQSAELNPSLPVYFARAEKSTLDLHF